MLAEDASALLDELGVAAGLDGVARLLSGCTALGLDAASIEADIEGLLTERLVLWASGGVRRTNNYRERQAFVGNRLKRLARRGGVANWTPSPSLVRQFANLSARLGQAGQGPRESVSTIDPRFRADLLASQGYRCAVCGVPLAQSVVRESRHFPDQREPQLEATLEHIEPFSVVGNRTPFELCCTHCNSLKRDRFGAHEDGLVVSGNLAVASMRPNVMRRMQFWTIYRSRWCDVRPCDVTSKESILYVHPREAPGVYGSLAVRCEVHAQQGVSTWVHAGYNAALDPDEEFDVSD